MENQNCRTPIKTRQMNKFSLFDRKIYRPNVFVNTLTIYNRKLQVDANELRFIPKKQWFIHFS